MSKSLMGIAPLAARAAGRGQLYDFGVPSIAIGAYRSSPLPVGLFTSKSEILMCCGEGLGIDEKIAWT